MEETEKTHTHSCFSIGSAGEIKNIIGFVAAPNSEFDPHWVTGLLGIQPHSYKVMGQPRPIGGGNYPFSDWTACYRNTPTLDMEEQVTTIARILTPKIPELLFIKEQYDVEFSIQVVPHIYREETPIISMNREIIDFCYHTGTEVNVDLYVYDRDEEKQNRRLAIWRNPHEANHRPPVRERRPKGPCLPGARHRPCLSPGRAPARFWQ